MESEEESQQLEKAQGMPGMEACRHSASLCTGAGVQLPECGMPLFILFCSCKGDQFLLYYIMLFAWKTKYR